jgi:glycerophosphoryl diester phosphodiesterase
MDAPAVEDQGSMSGRAVEVIGHAGAAGFHPHNSADSLRKAIELGVDRIEVDLLSAAGDMLVLAHDAQVLIDGRWEATHMLTVDRLRDILNGMVTLEEAAALSAGGPPLLLDIKGRHYVTPLLQAIAEDDAQRRMSACGTHARVLRRLRRAFPAMRLGLSRGHSLTKIQSRRLRRIAGFAVSLAQVLTLLPASKWCGAQEVMIQHHICTIPLVAACHAVGLRVNAWTVDDPEDIRRVLGAGADGVISNRPDRVIHEVFESGLRRIEPRA